MAVNLGKLPASTVCGASAVRGSLFYHWNGGTVPSLYENTLSELALQRELLSNLDTRIAADSAAVLRRATILLFESPLCVAALEDESSRWKSNLSERTTRTLDIAIKHDLFLLALSMQGPEWDSTVHRWMVKDVDNTAKKWGHNLVQIAQKWHRELPGTSTEPYFLITDYEALLNVLTHLHDSLRVIPGHESAPFRDTTLKVFHLIEQLNSFRRNLRTATSLADSLETLSHAPTLRHFHNVTSAMLAEQDLNINWNHSHILNQFATDEALRRKLAVGAIHLIDVIVFRIRSQSIPAHVLSRLVVYLERFAKEDICAEISTSSRLTESIIQFHVDSFIFGEGLYPITHAEAANGKIDTFVEDASSLFAEAEKPGNTSVLIELKQAMSGATKEALEKLAEEALHQAAQYQAHLNACRKWAGHKVVVIVAYKGDVRYFVNRDDVFMVYLGDKTPSQAKAIVLDLPEPSAQTRS